MARQAITASVISEDARGHVEQLPVELAVTGENISFREMEETYKRAGGTFMHAWFGADPFDFWFGRFYVGTFGALSLVGIFFGVFFYFYQVWVVEGTFNLLQARIDPPPVSAGLRLMSANEPGFFWQMIMFSATIAFFGWMMRQADISRKLGMSYEIPIAYGAVFSSFVTLQWLRPLAMGAWGNGFAFGITHHLDWVSNIGYQYYNFFYNPFHAIGVSLLFGSTLLLSMHGSAILSAARYTDIKEENVDGFWRNIIGYSIGEIGIHRAAFWVSISAVLFANLCIFLSGTLVFSWVGFWEFWDKAPIWQGATLMTTAAVGMTLWRGKVFRRPRPSAEDLEYGGYGLFGRLLRNPINFEPFRRLFGVGQVGPIYVGIPGITSIVAGGLAAFIILENYLWQVGYNPVLFLREFLVLSLDPPPMSYGLSFAAPWHEGGGWVFATFLLHIAIIAWWIRIYSRAKAAGLTPMLAYGFLTAMLLYFVIYLIRPIIIGNWAQAPGQGFKAVVDWTNNLSILYGNFYYNPFHMISIFFLLGSTVLLAMHGATIVATSAYGSHREIEEMMVEDTGTHRAQLFWRWTMGFNVNSKTIHDWAWWFAAGVVIAGAIGLLLTGTVVENWFLWAESIGIVAPLP